MRREIADSLLTIEAVFLSPQKPFTWASGIKSPIYCDNRLTLSYPKVRTQIEEGLVSLIKEKFPDTNLIMGTSTAGIAHAAIIGHLMNLPMGYVRGSKKDHGRTNQIEGRLQAGQKVVVVEDLVSTGGSVIEVVEILREAGAEVLGVVSIFTYGMRKSLDRFREAGVEYYSLSDFDAVIEVALEKGLIQACEREGLLCFRDNPQDEIWMSYLA